MEPSWGNASDSWHILSLQIKPDNGDICWLSVLATLILLLCAMYTL